MRTLGLAVGYLLFLLVVAELAARLLLALPLVADHRRFHDELSWRRGWVRRHRAEAEIRYEFDVYDPATGWRPRPGLRDVPVFGDKVLNTNSRGLRGRREYAYGKRPDGPRLLVLGDSFTFGDEVSDTETYPHYLEERLPCAEVLNMGVHGFGHDQMLILLRTEGVRYRPDVVLLGFVAADMSRNLVGFRDYAKPRFVRDGPGLRLVGSPVPAPAEILREEWARPRLRDMWSLAVHEFRKWTGLEEKEERALTARVLDEMAAVAGRAGAAFVLAYLPVWQEIESGAATTAGERFLFDYCAGRPGLRCVSTRPAFTGSATGGASYRRGTHWTPAGHRAAAAAIAAHLGLRCPEGAPAPGAAGGPGS